MNNYRNLSDALLIEAYKEAIKLSLNKDFINLLKEEITHRKLEDKL